MHTILKIFKRDIKSIFTNYVAVIMIVGVSILPALYAWFNIMSNWDPYGNTQGIKIAIVNEDTGYKVDDNNINVGDDVVNELKDNHDLGWEFVDENKATYGMTHGKYYASIRIPNDFSKNISTLMDDAPKKAELIYTINQKTNAIAPKITEVGASTLKDTISENIIASVNKSIFTIFNDIGIQMNNNLQNIKDISSAIIYTNDNIDSIEYEISNLKDASIDAKTVIDGINKNLPKIESSLKSAQDVSITSLELLKNAKSFINVISNLIDKDMKHIQNQTNLAITALEDIKKDINGLEPISSKLEDINKKLLSIQTSIDSTISKIESLNNILNNNILNGQIKVLKDISLNIKNQADMASNLTNDIAYGKSNLNDSINTLEADLSEIGNLAGDFLSKYKAQTKPQLLKITDELINLNTTAKDVVINLQNLIPTASKSLTLANSSIGFAADELSKVEQNIPKYKSSLNLLADKMSIMQDDVAINKLLDTLQTDPQLISSYIATPVVLTEKTLFPIPNYGSGMTPFYTVLALWVGTLILLAIISVNVKKFDDNESIKYYEEYFGRLLTIGFIAMVQGLIVSIGDRFLLGAYMVHTWGFIFMSCFISIIFTIIVYTLVSILGNIGKAVSIVVMVLQVAGSGGTFPIEVTPPFFRWLYEFLPFTYAIGALREIQGGIVWDNLVKDIFILASFAGVFLIVALVFKKPLAKFKHFFESEFYKTGLGE